MVLRVHPAILGVTIGESGKKAGIVALFRHTLILGSPISEPDFSLEDRHHAAWPDRGPNVQHHSYRRNLQACCVSTA